MITDLESDDLPESISADICIIGGGAAGISMAVELAGTRWQVALLEAGGESPDSRTQAIYEGKNVGRDYFPLHAARTRSFGGTTHQWGGWSVPLAPGDLRQRDWVPHSGWPIPWQELERFYDRAQELCEIDRLDFDPHAWLEPNFPLLPIDDSLLEHYLYKWSPADPHRPPTNFGVAYRDHLRDSDNIQVVLHANVIDFQCTESVEHVNTTIARSLAGDTLRVEASVFVLAVGGLETPRLLLSSNSQMPEGLGNQNDLVGRYFMEHLEGIAGHILIDKTNNARWLTSYEKRLLPNERVSVSAALRPSDRIQAEKRILAAALVLRSQTDQQSGYVSAKRIALALRGEEKSRYARDLANVLTDLDEVALWIHHRRKGTNYEFPITKDPVKIWFNSEQAPNPDSRVYLTDDVDELGMRKIALDWQLGALEKKTLREATMIFAGEIGRLKKMRVKLEEWLVAAGDDMPTSKVWGGWHHMGTARMSDSPTTGVVDPDCRVYGLDNFFLAGSAVFPTGGYANPTLTLIALAVRLARHIDATLTVGS